MDATPLAIPDVILLHPKVFGDDRGFFFESFNQAKFEAAIGRQVTFVQDNHSRSNKNVLRGLHYQIHQPQSKLVRVVQGEVFDVAVDIRKSSPTFGQWVGGILSAENKCQMWVPEGFAHGFVVLSDTADVLYKATAYYSPKHERCICWDDPDYRDQVADRTGADSFSQGSTGGHVRRRDIILMQHFSTSPIEMATSIWRNRSLTFQMTKREVLGRYRGSVLGLAWSLFHPLVMLMIYTFVFSVVFRARWPGMADNGSMADFALALFVGMILHGIFAECVNRAPSLILSNVNYVKKVVFPLEILPWVAMGPLSFTAPSAW